MTSHGQMMSHGQMVSHDQIPSHSQVTPHGQMTSHESMTSQEPPPEPRTDPAAESGIPTPPADSAPSNGERDRSPTARADSESESDSDSDSGQSGVSNISGLNWKPNAGPICWVQEQIGAGVDPREVLGALRPGLRGIPPHIDDIALWKLVIEMLSEPPRREKLRHVNTLADVVRLIRGARNVIVLTGAGVSVSCGIPDFRSRDGIYARLAVDFPDLPDPQAMFDIHYFRRDPRPFFKFAREIYPGQFRPSPCHRFIRMLERQGKLLRNYTQNIDTLEQQAGIENVIQCHGSFATASCQRCRHRVQAEAIRDAIFEQTIPACERCAADEAAAGDAAGGGDEGGVGGEEESVSQDSVAGCSGNGRGSGVPEAAADDRGRPGGGSGVDGSSEDRPLGGPAEDGSSEDRPDGCSEDRPDAADEDTGDSGFVASARETDDDTSRTADLDHRPPAIMKPDIVFFGEGLSDEFHRSMEQDRERCDLLIIIGSSLKVRPVALIPSSVKPEVAQILINREPLPHLNCDVQLLGDCDVIVDHLCHLLGGRFSELLRDPAASRPLQELTELPPRTAEPPPPPADPAHEGDMDALRLCWQRKVKESVAARLPEGTYLHQPPGRYIFPGAEVLVDPDDSDSDNDSSGSEDDSGPEAGPSSEADRSGSAEVADGPAAEPASRSDPCTASAPEEDSCPPAGGMKRPLDAPPSPVSQKRAARTGAEGEQPAASAPAPAPSPAAVAAPAVAVACSPAGAASVS